MLRNFSPTSPGLHGSQRSKVLMVFMSARSVLVTPDHGHDSVEKTRGAERVVLVFAVSA